MVANVQKIKRIATRDFSGHGSAYAASAVARGARVPRRRAWFSDQGLAGCGDGDMAGEGLATEADALGTGNDDRSAVTGVKVPGSMPIVAIVIP
jgi:hypothetical protein